MKTKLLLFIDTFICSVFLVDIAYGAACTTLSSPTGTKLYTITITGYNNCTSKRTRYVKNGTSAYVVLQDCVSSSACASGYSGCGYTQNISGCTISVNNCVPPTCSPSNWTAYSTGYQYRGAQVCSSGCQNTYRCAAGYYGTPTSGTSGCTKCPAADDVYTNSSLTTLATPTSTAGSNSTKSYCYLSPGTYYDANGKFTYSSTCTVGGYPSSPDTSEYPTMSSSVSYNGQYYYYTATFSWGTVQVGSRCVNVSSGLTSKPTSENGAYCWCVSNFSDDAYAYSGKSYSNQSTCATTSNCVSYCKTQVANNSSFRTSLFK